MRNKLERLISEIMFPKKCISCGEVMEAATMREIIYDLPIKRICNKCRPKIKYIGNRACYKCGKAVENDLIEYCEDCSRVKHIFDRNIAVFDYTDFVRTAIYKLKYNGVATIGEYFGEEMVERYGDAIKRLSPSVIIPVPIHKSRMKKRGYNQAQVLAEVIAKRTGIELNPYVLVRSRATVPMKEIDKNGRKKNVENAFKIVGNVVKYPKVILVDDIYTTGSTLDACAWALKRAGVKEVYSITISIGKVI